MSIQDRRAREFERRGQDILAAALALFESDDWESVTVEQIAQRAEVGKGTIYKHFASKDEIYARLAIQFQRQTLQRYADIDASLPVVERFKRHLAAGWEMHLSSKELHRVFLYCSRVEFRAHLPADVMAEVQQVERAVAEPTHRMMAEGIEQGLFPRKPLPLLLFGAQSAFWGAIQLIWSGYLGDIDEAVYLDEITTFILAGLVHHERPIGKAPTRAARARAMS